MEFVIRDHNSPDKRWPRKTKQENYGLSRLYAKG